MRIVSTSFTGIDISVKLAEVCDIATHRREKITGTSATYTVLQISRIIISDVVGKPYCV